MLWGHHWEILNNILNKGPSVSTLHWAPQIMTLT